MKRVLVTGGAGFIGSHLVDSLLADGFKVTVVDNFDPFYGKSIKLRNILPHLRHSAYRLVECDIRDLQKMCAALPERYDIVVHLAAKAGVRPSIEQPEAYQRVNVGGTQNVLSLARLRGAEQFIFASSSSVYGVNPNVPWQENDPVLLPVSPYAATKVAGELLGHVYSHLYKLRFVALRLFTVYGPRQRPDLAIHKFASQMLKGQTISIFGDGSTLRDYTFVGDIVAGIRASMDYRGSCYEVLNLGNHQPVRLDELVRGLERELGITAKLQFFPPQPGDVPVTFAEISKAARLLSFRPRTTLADGLEQFVRWYRPAISSAAAG